LCAASTRICAIRIASTIAAAALESCSAEELEPHLEGLRSSKKKAHKALLATLEKKT